MCIPLEVVDLVCVLSLLSLFLIGFIGQHLDALPSSGLILTGFCHGIQLADLILLTHTQRGWSVMIHHNTHTSTHPYHMTHTHTNKTHITKVHIHTFTQRFLPLPLSMALPHG